MSRTLRLLLIEDSVDDAQMVLHELKRGGFEPDCKRVDTEKAFNSALDNGEWDLIISDHSMAGFRAVDALGLLKKREADIPFIVVSGAVGEEPAAKAIQAGASEYIPKSQLTKLVPSVEREMRDAWSRRAWRRAEETLQRGQQELAEFFEHAAVGLHWEGPDGAILRVNQSELDMLGYAREEYLGHRISEFCVDEGVAEDIMCRLHSGETLQNYEARLRCKNGSIKQVLFNSNVIWENGHFIHTRCFTRDITDRKRGEEAVAYLAAIVESSEDAIIGQRLDGTIVSWNSGAEHLYGYTADEIRGRSITALALQYRPQELPEIYARIKEGNRIERFETVRLRKDGTTVDVSLVISPIKDNQGKVIGISSIERDISAQIREDQERLRLIDELTVALASVRTLRGLLPICASCKKIRDDHGYWQKVESYVCEHTEAEFTHGICPDCMRKLYPDYPIKRDGATS